LREPTIYGQTDSIATQLVKSIATQLVKNGTYRTGDRESTRLVNKELSDRWKIPTPEGYSISEPFRPEELAAALTPGRL